MKTNDLDERPKTFDECPIFFDETFLYIRYMDYMSVKNFEGIMTYDEMCKVSEVGDIVAYPTYAISGCGVAWDYVLLRENFPEDFDTALCCNKDPREPFKANLCQIGFHWCGSKDNFSFRQINEKEKEDFVNACLDAIKKPILPEGWGWNKDHYAQILGALIKYGLITEYKAKQINKELKAIHGVDILSIYNKYWKR